MTVLDLLKAADCGLTREQLLAKARGYGVEHPLQELKELIEKGIARKDKCPEPCRFKATPAAWST
jgi:hypothetical protein